MNVKHGTTFVTLLIIITLGPIAINCQLRFACDPKYCENQAGPCPEIDCSDGRLVKNATECGCCHICIKQQDKGDKCYNRDVSDLPKVECGPGLKCINGVCKAVSTKCTKEQEEHDKNSGLGELTTGKPRPKCNEFGYYEPVSCKPGMLCYCVDKDGNRIFGTGSHIENATTNCNCSRRFSEFSGQLRSQHQFLRCLDNGNYDPLQCVDDACFCVGDDGKLDGRVIDSNSTSLAALKCYNDKRHRDYLSQCWREYEAVRKQVQDYTERGTNVIGVDLPSCDLDGSYSPVQCKKEKCYCVNKDGLSYGNEYIVKRNSDDAKKMNCRCLREKELLRKYLQSNRVTQIFAQYKCGPNGNYLPVQCVAPLCFCVDEMGFQYDETVLMYDRHFLSCYNREFEKWLD